MSQKMEPNCFSLLENLAASDRALKALTFYQGHSKKGSLTYGEFLDQVNTLTDFLKSELKLAAGERVLILSPNRLEVPVVLFALWRIGAVVVPLNPNVAVEDWAFIAKHSKARGAFIASDFAAKIASLGHPFEFILELEKLTEYKTSAQASLESVSGSKLATILYTSGTTGSPKGVGLSQFNLISNGKSMAKRFEMNRTTQFAVLPLYHAHALGFGLMSALSTRGHLVFTDKIDPFSWSKVIADEQVTYTSVVPSLIPLLLAARVKKEKLPSLKAMLVSSAPLTIDVAREFETKTGIPIVQGWGLSEYTNFACCLSPLMDSQERESLLFHKEGTSIGSPLDDTEVKVVDENGAELPLGTKGELMVRGPSRMLGYYEDAQNTQAAITEDGWLKTGDQGFFLQQGEAKVFFVAGRIKEIIIRGGEKFSPLAIEQKLLAQLPELQGHFVALGFPHQLYGEEVGGYLEIEKLNDSLKEKLQQALEKIHADSRPKIVIVSPLPIPRTHTGKIQRRKLQPLFEEFKDCKGPAKIINRS
jgi:long-chain acyl-CoA synthetase